MKKVLISLASVIGLLLIYGLVAPKDFQVEREITINKPKDFVFNQLKFVKNHDTWSPWSKKDPNMTKDYRGTDGSVGFVSSWSGNNEVGVGEQEIKNIVEGERIELELRFKKPMENTGSAYFVTESVNEGQTKVKWGMMGKSPFPMNILCALMNMKSRLGETFVEGLTSLKNLLEKQ